MSDNTSSAAATPKKERSPSFPFIPLKGAIERLEAFEKHFGRHSSPATLVGPAWGMKAQSSQSDQTLAALRSFGLLNYEGIGPKRLVSITEDGRRYLRAQQDSVKDAVLKQAALRPRIIRKFWAIWGADRPPDAVALDTLILENGFSDTGARAFLKVYDDTVAYAKLSGSDKAVELGDANDDELGDENSSDPPPPPPPPPPPAGQKATLMAGERELTAGLLSKGSNFRLIVSGQIGVKEIERLIAKLEIDKEILAEADDDEPEGDD
jgi:hypothetical protein